MVKVLLSWLATKTVVVASVAVTVVAVPALVIASHRDVAQASPARRAAATTPRYSDAEAVLVRTVRRDDDSAIAAVEAAESNCDARITALAATATVPAAQAQAAVARGRAEVHTVVLPLVAALHDDEREFDALPRPTPELETVVVAQVLRLVTTALGDGHTTGSLTASCDSIVVQVQVSITVQQPPPPPAPVNHESDEGDD